MDASPYGMSQATNLAERSIEWITIVCIAGCYALFFAFTVSLSFVPDISKIFLLTPIITFFYSLQHEVTHGHPTKYPYINELLISLPIGFVFPFRRFRDLHLVHHATGELTDPMDDPESFYLSEYQWTTRAAIARNLLVFHNTIAGRMILGPALSMFRFIRMEIRYLLGGGKMARAAATGWMVHFVGLAILLAFLFQTATMSFWSIAAAIYLALSLLSIRTFLEHQASPEHGERTVVIEKLCPLAFIFLYNNLHIVHHTRPAVAWYDLPSLYRENKEQYLRHNRHYFYRSYYEIIGKYFLTPKEPVAHPFLAKGDRSKIPN